MSHPLLGGAYEYDDSYGAFVHERHKRIATIIHDYDESLALVAIPPGKRDSEEEKQWPYMVVQFEHGALNLVSLWGEEDLTDNRILEHIFENDFRKHEPDEIYRNMLAKNKARELMEAKKAQDESEAAWDRAKFMLQTPLHTINMGNGRKIRS